METQFKEGNRLGPFFSLRRPWRNVRGSSQCHRAKHCPFQCATPKFTIVKRALSSPPHFLTSALALLCAWHLTVCGCLWSLQGIVLSGSAGAPDAHNWSPEPKICPLSSVVERDPSRMHVCRKEAEPFWIFRTLNVAMFFHCLWVFCFVALRLCPKRALKDFTEILLSLT